MERFFNLLKLWRVLKERGNWPLIRRSRRQLVDFLLCRNSLNRKPLPAALAYWWWMLKGYEVLVWRLETFGFLFLPGLSEEERARLNRFL